MKGGSQKEVLYVEVQKSHGFNMISVKEFTSMSASDRTELVDNGQVQFLDEDGDIINAHAALTQLGLA